ncbi:MAG TPA: DUF359 domain-containing protein [Thermoplasmatales archaeon]|nr:DUF359 domain-containing protein [Thermoplasmatales archaeon]
MNVDIKYVLPEELRATLRQPLGLLLGEEELLRKLKEYKGRIVSIGDIVTATILKHDIKPIFCIIDFKTKRGEIPREIRDIIESYGDIVLKIENPPGTISTELWENIEDIYRNPDRYVRIEIIGEEDLAALPAILLAPNDVTIIYGLPDKGVVFVPSEGLAKQKIREILEKM